MNTSITDRLVHDEKFIFALMRKKEWLTLSQKIENYWQRFAKKNDLTLPMPDTWAFGDGTKTMGDELGQLVLSGKKTATCSAYWVYEMENEPLPKVGQYDIVLDGEEQPLAIIQYTAVDLVSMQDVSIEFAQAEGEGDLSYEYWYRAHVDFFTWELAQYGKTFSPEMTLVCQNFKVVDRY